MFDLVKYPTTPNNLQAAIFDSDKSEPHPTPNHQSESPESSVKKQLYSLLCMYIAVVVSIGFSSLIL